MFNNIGQAYFTQELQHLAKDNFEQALTIYEACENKKDMKFDILMALINTGICYRKINDYRMSIEFQVRCLEFVDSYYNHNHFIKAILYHFLADNQYELEM